MMLKKNLESRRDEFIESQIDSENIKEVWLYAQQAGVIKTLQAVIDDDFLEVDEEEDSSEDTSMR